MIFIVSDIIVLPHFSDTNCYLKFKYYIECFDIFILPHFSDTNCYQKFKYDIDHFLFLQSLESRPFWYKTITSLMKVPCPFFFDPIAKALWWKKMWWWRNSDERRSADKKDLIIKENLTMKKIWWKENLAKENRMKENLLIKENVKIKSKTTLTQLWCKKKHCQKMVIR